VQNTGVYISNEFSLLTRLKAIIGIRGEKYVQRHTGRDIDYANSGIGNNLDNDIVLEAFDLFPTASLIYALTGNQNLRFAYSRTIARPSFKELSFAQILDPITNRYFNGGLYTYSDWDGKLGSTRIQNYDMRWEMFMEQAQLISLSVFYKSFDDPIELVRIPEQQTGTEYQPRNVGDGQLYGTEIEIRKTLDFVSPSLSQFSFNTNVTVVKSQIDMTSTEYNSRKSYEKEGEHIDNTREMAGQAPYIINAGFSYDNFDVGMEAGLFYNVKGKTLTIVGAGLFPDVYTNPFHSLIFNINKTIGKEKKASVNFNISNLLNDAYEEVYSAFQAEDQIFTRYSPKVAMSLGFKYSL
jgi:outer membrane receptor protein involved in Fe transport